MPAEHSEEPSNDHSDDHSDELSEATRRFRDQMPLAATLGLVVLGWARDEVRVRLDSAPELCTAGGALHGGAVMALADSAGGACAFANLPEDATGTTTVESKTNFLGAVRGGWVEACARPLHVGRTVIVVTTDVIDDRGRLVARVTQTQLVLGARP